MTAFDDWDTIAITDKKGTGNIGRPSMFNISKLNAEAQVPCLLWLSNSTSQPCHESIQIEENTCPFKPQSPGVQNTLISLFGHVTPIFSAQCCTDTVS